MHSENMTKSRPTDKCPTIAKRRPIRNWEKIWVAEFKELFAEVLNM